MRNRSKLLVGVLAVVSGLLIAALLFSQQAYSIYTQSPLGLGVRMNCAGVGCRGVDAVSEAGPFLTHNRGRGWFGPRANYTATVEEVQLEGRLTELDKGYLVIESGGERYTVKTPMWLFVDNQSVSLVRLAFEDRLNAGDQVKIVANRVTVSRNDGSEASFYVLRQLVDLTTGLEASHPLLRQMRAGWRSSMVLDGF
ncbi:MAG: hypothetical protein QXO86_03330 [Nitrososphaerota archaeon]